GRLHAGERHDVEVLAEDVLEAALRQAPVERHLAALEAVDGNAGARLLALDATPGGLAGARADAAAEALAVVRRAFVVAQFVEFHRLSPRAALSALVVDAHEMLDGGDHAAHGLGVFERDLAVQLVQAEPDERAALHVGPADRAADLLDDDRLASLFGHGPTSAYSSAATAAPRRPSTLHASIPPR